MLARSRLPVVALLVGWLVALAAAPAAAHPHAWIDVRVEVLFDAGHKVAGLRENWLFDEYYTAFAMEGLGKNGRGVPAQQDVDAITRENIKNLRPYAYFTKVDYKGKTLTFQPAAEVSAKLQRNRLDMTFTVRFAAPVDLAGGEMVYAVYDPSYYIEMLHAEAKDAIRLDNAPAGCGYRLVKATPPLDAIAKAASLDATHTTDDTLGALFAERVHVTCP